MPNLQLPYGNPKHDEELGLVVHVSNPSGETYIFNINEYFKNRGKMFRVRRPKDFSFLKSVVATSKDLADQDKVSQFGSRNGLYNDYNLTMY